MRVSRLCLLAAMLAGQPVSAQQIDREYDRLIREFTSDPRFLPASVLDVPEHATIPSPREHFGTIIGAPGIMHHTGDIYAYYRALAAVSPRIRVETMGTTEEGRELVLVTIADDATMGRLEHYRQQLARLADPRTLPAAQVSDVMTGAKPVYYLNGGLHSPEMGSPEMLMELAYRLVTSDRSDIRRIRENVIVLINPVSEPDGRDKQVDWYYRYTKDRTDYDDGFPRSSPYWGRYIYHDNNRDGIQISAALTKAIFDGYFRWHPTIMHDLHESVPLLYIMTGTGPYNEEIDPITIGEWQVLANHDLTSVTAEGLPGAFTWAFYDGWWPGYGIWVANNHNSIGRFYETFGNAGATTYVRDLSNARYAGDPVTERTWYRPEPPTRKVRWSARDNTNYMQAGVLASLSYAANNGTLLLNNFYRKGANSIERGRTKKPHAFVIPKTQRDPTRAAYLVNQLRRQAIEVHRRTQGDSAGDYVIKLDQPYRNLAVTLLTKQTFPADAQHPPYDDIAWTLGYLYGVDVKAVDDTMVFHWRGLELMRDSAVYRGTVAGSGGVHVIANRAQAGLLPALHWLKQHAPGARAYAAEAMFTIDGDVVSTESGRGPRNAVLPDTFPAGSLVLEGVSSGVAGGLAGTFGLDLRALATAPDVDRHALDLPRVGLYHTWYSTQDEGWARYTFEQLGIPYTSIDKDDLRGGDLRSRFDVILIPNVGGDLEQMIHGVDRRFGPMPFTKTDASPAHGTPDATDDMTGGPGFEGIANLQAFVEAGGTLITLGNATRFAAETGITRVFSTHAATGLFHPGSVVRAKARQPANPVLYGFPETFHLFRGNGTLWQVAKRDRGTMVLQYGTKPLEDEQERTDGPMLGMPETKAQARTDTAGLASRTGVASADSGYVLSGMVRNENQIVGHGAIFAVPVGRGQVVAFSFNPLHRFLNQHEFPLVWNALMNWNDLNQD
ncbi:MAG: M14 family zinc carboxypeptidase [Longimicrobiales bacterium]